MSDYPGDWDQRRKQVYNRDGYECQNCGTKGGPRGERELHAHHIVPKNSGGTHNSTNLVTLCEDCHRSVHNNVSAPTANSADSVGETEDLIELMLMIKIALGAARLPLAEVEDEDELPPTPPLGLYIYSSSIYYDVYPQLIEYAAREEQLPEELYQRYTISREICLGLLNHSEDIPAYENMFHNLIEVVRRSRKPEDEISEFLANSREVTLNESIENLAEYQLTDASESYSRFVRQSRELVDIFQERFILYDQIVSVNEYRVPTVASSFDDGWKITELDEELSQILPKWENTLVEIAEAGMEVAQKTSANTSEGCFIATAASPEVNKINALRDFRDNTLKNSVIGHLFIRFYYWGSPPIARWISSSARRQFIVRMLIVQPAYWLTTVTGLSDN